jgi:hypothetical protein
MGKYIIVLFIITSLLYGCSTKPAPCIDYLVPFSNSTLEKEKPFSIQGELDKLNKPEKPEPIYLNIDSTNNSIKITNPNDATHVAYSDLEYNKIVKILILTNKYKEIIKLEQDLINIKIDQINSLKELLILEQQKSRLYYHLYETYYTLYHEEMSSHKMDNLVNKAGLYLISIGSIILLAIGL